MQCHSYQNNLNIMHGQPLGDPEFNPSGFTNLIFLSSVNFYVEAPSLSLGIFLAMDLEADALFLLSVYGMDGLGFLDDVACCPTIPHYL